MAEYLSDDPRRLRPVVDRALAAKLPKLAKAAADRRLLVLEKRTTDAETAVLETVLAVAEARRAWSKVDWLAIADAFACETDRIVRLGIWDVKAGEWCELWKLEIVSDATAPMADSGLGTLLDQARLRQSCEGAQHAACLRRQLAGFRRLVPMSTHARLSRPSPNPSRCISRIGRTR